MNEAQLISDEVYVLDGIQPIKEIARQEEKMAEFGAPAWNRQQRRRFKKAQRKRGKGFTR